ncbi:heterocyst-inhibiting protein PatX [Scytonema sp. PCC 10023]|uniref:heterocyst-inhibiting protein PatX n=1 Tax=Scytonema sp. PCC 10023 TaxID=1680591 RepID=UPI0039C61375
MRAAISFLITGLLFGSLAANSQVPGIHLSNSGSQQLMSAKGNTKKSTSSPYRGSGRDKDKLMEYVESTPPAV